MSAKKSRGMIFFRVEECKGCALCVDACPVNVLELSSELNSHGYHPATYKGEGCTGCGVCYYVCPEPGGIKVYKRYDPEKHTAEVQ
ncbi:MAG: NAD(P)H-quinone oxidoreductase subunit I, chloroplastic [Candidatus Marinimicrobia bacterium]|nr:NAD(P)H-quinone oxidoreductase subunit I, chloroplastic [Candidatus Neomarinimicrobiota bacterium]